MRTYSIRIALILLTLAACDGCAVQRERSDPRDVAPPAAALLDMLERYTEPNREDVADVRRLIRVGLAAGDAWDAAPDDAKPAREGLNWPAFARAMAPLLDELENVLRENAPADDPGWLRSRLWAITELRAEIALNV